MVIICICIFVNSSVRVRVRDWRVRDANSATLIKDGGDGSLVRLAVKR